MALPAIAVKAAQAGAKRLLARQARRAAARRATRAAARTGPSGRRSRLQPRPWWLLALWALAPAWFVVFAAALLIASVAVVGGGLPGGDHPPGPAPGAVAGIPPMVLDAYARAAADTPWHAPGCTGMRWAVLAGIGRVESHHAAGRPLGANGDVDHPPILGPRLDGTDDTALVFDTDAGRYDRDPLFDRAVGLMQFIPTSWEIFGRDGDGDGEANPHNVYDAAAGAVAHLCGTGTADLADRAQLSRALFAYNPNIRYVREVLRWIAAYDALGAAGPGTVPCCVPAPDGADTTATLIGIMAASGLAHQVTSTRRPGDTGSYHGAGQAVDFAVPGRDNPALLAINQYWARHAAGLAELLHTGPGATCVKDGAVVSCGPEVWGRADVDAHHDHVHVAATPQTLRRLGIGSLPYRGGAAPSATGDRGRHSSR